jgi:hypothetical protein
MLVHISVLNAAVVQRSIHIVHSTTLHTLCSTTAIKLLSTTNSMLHTPFFSCLCVAAAVVDTHTHTLHNVMHYYYCYHTLLYTFNSTLAQTEMAAVMVANTAVHMLVLPTSVEAQALSTELDK